MNCQEDDPVERCTVWESVTQVTIDCVRTYENRKKAVFIRAFSSKKASGRLCARKILRKKLFSYVHFALTEASLNALLQHIESAERQFSRKAEAAYRTVAGTPQQIEAKILTAKAEAVSRMKRLAGSLSLREKNIMKNIRSFSPLKGVRYPARAGELLKKAVSEVKQRVPGIRKK